MGDRPIYNETLYNIISVGISGRGYIYLYRHVKKTKMIHILSTCYDLQSDCFCLLPAAYVVRGKVLFSQVSVCPHLGGGGVPTFWAGGVPTFPGLEGGTYLPRSGWGGTYLPRWGGGGTYLSRSGWGGVPTFPGRSTYLGRGVPTLAGGYLSWRGGGTVHWWGGVPTLAGGYLPWQGGTPYLGR